VLEGFDERDVAEAAFEEAMLVGTTCPTCHGSWWCPPSLDWAQSNSSAPSPPNLPLAPTAMCLSFTRMASLRATTSSKPAAVPLATATLTKVSALHRHPHRRPHQPHQQPPPHPQRRMLATPRRHHSHRWTWP
jgi:hypothetical protein